MRYVRAHLSTAYNKKTPGLWDMFSKLKWMPYLAVTTYKVRDNRARNKVPSGDFYHVADIFILQQIHRIAIPPPRFHYSPTPASTLAFDTQQELLWVGNEYVSDSDSA